MKSNIKKASAKFWEDFSYFHHLCRFLYSLQISDYHYFKEMTGIEVRTLRPDFTSKLVHELAFGTPKFYIAPYDKINYVLVNMSSNCDVKSGLNVIIWLRPTTNSL